MANEVPFQVHTFDVDNLGEEELCLVIMVERPGDPVCVSIGTSKWPPLPPKLAKSVGAAIISAGDRSIACFHRAQRRIAEASALPSGAASAETHLDRMREE